MPEFLKPWVNHRRKRFWALLALLVYTLLGFLAAPRLVEKLLVDGVTASGRTAVVREVRTNPFVLTLQLDGIEIGDTQGVALVRLEQLFVNFQLSSLFHWAWTFKEVRLDGLFLSEERFESGDTRFSRWLRDLAQAGGDDAETPVDNSGPPRLIIHALGLNAARIEFTDRLAGDFAAELGPIRARIDNLRTLPDHSGRKQVSITTSTGGRIEWSGDLRFHPMSSRGHLQIHGEGLSDVSRYASHFLPFTLAGRNAGLQFDYRVALGDEGAEVALDGISAGLEDLQATMPDQPDPWVAIGALHLDGGELRWPEQRLRFDTLALDRLEVDGWLDEAGRLNLEAMAPAANGPGDSDPAPNRGATASAWSAGIEAITLADASVRFQDRGLASTPALGVEGLDLVLRGFDMARETGMPLELDFRLASGGQARYQGEVCLCPELVTAGTLAFTELDLRAGQPWLSEVMRVQLRSGLLSLEGELTTGPDQPGSLRGALTVDGLHIDHPASVERLLGWERLQAGEFALDLAAGRLETSQLVFQRPFARVHIAQDLSTNLDGLWVEPAADTGAGSEGGTLETLIGGIRFEDGELDFTDLSLPLPFAADIESLNGEISALSTISAEPATVRLEGQVNEFGLARIEGALDPWDMTRQARIEMVFRNLDMSRLTPYTVQFAGYAIDDGRLDLDLLYTLADRRLEGANDIVVRELELGEKVDHPDAGSLPLKLAVALLTDAQGVIDIDLPISGDLDDPQFRISGVLWRALGNLITKAVTAPFRLLGALVGAESEDFGVLQFPPGRSDLSPPDREKLVKLAEALQQRPELGVRVGGAYAPGVDREALQRARVEAAIAARMAAAPADDALRAERERAALESLFAERLPGQPLEAEQARFRAVPGDDPEAEAVLDELAYSGHLRQRLVEAESIGEEALATLASARATIVLDSLRAAHPGQELDVVEGEVEAVEPDEVGLVPLELEVTAE